MNKLRLSKSCIGVAEKDAVMRVLNNGYLGMGEAVRDFENELSKYFGRPAICVVNGTAALQLALQAAGVGEGDEVLIQSMTYVASFQAIRATGAKPIACEIYPDDFTIDLKDAQNKISARTKAIMPVHYSGGGGDLDSLYRFAARNKLRVIEDAAHAFGSIVQKKLVGSHGDIACFSFDGIKNITSGEGGCIVTDDPAVISAVRDSRLLGVIGDTEKRYKGKRSWEFDVTSQGWRYHMSDIMAAIGKVQLMNFEHHKSRRQKLAKYYERSLSDVVGIETIKHDYNEVVPHIFVVKLEEGLDRDIIKQILEQAGIPTGIHYKPNHMLTLFSESAPDSLPVTEAVFPTLLTLPLHPELNYEDVDLIVEKLEEVIESF